jgi:hypothetical protein
MTQVGHSLLEPRAAMGSGFPPAIASSVQIPPIVWLGGDLRLTMGAEVSDV